MARKELQDLPPEYTNLGYDGETTAGPSAPKSSEGAVEQGLAVCPPGPSAPSFEIPENLGPPPMFYSPPSLVFEEIYEACAKYVKKHCCYGSRFINQMKLTSIVNKGVFYYTLESFGEKRETVYRERPYRGGSVDGPESGPAPDPWDMYVTPAFIFKKCSSEREVPHTQEVGTCSRCDGDGKVECSSCYGRGTTSCSRCSGSGRDSEDERCSSCSGSGDEQCSWCSGDGQVTCSRCDGYGKVMDYRVLIVTWENHVSEFMSEKGKLPDEKIRKAEGIQLLREAYPSLQPITNAPDQSVNDASARLLQTHKTAFPTELIIRQRHTLRVVPYTKVNYRWKEREGEFYVYGNDRSVYFEDYPQQCCCCTCC